MLKNIYRKLEKGRATARVAPTEKRERAGQNPAPTEGYKGRGKRAVGDAGPYGGLQGARKNGRGRTPPLRRGYKECGRAGDRKGRPYGM